MSYKEKTIDSVEKLHLLKPTWIRDRENIKPPFNKLLPTGQGFRDYKPCPAERGVLFDVWFTKQRQ